MQFRRSFRLRTHLQAEFKTFPSCLRTSWYDGAGRRLLFPLRIGRGGAPQSSSSDTATMSRNAREEAGCDDGAALDPPETAASLGPGSSSERVQTAANIDSQRNEPHALRRSVATDLRSAGSHHGFRDPVSTEILSRLAKPCLGF